MLFKLNIIFFFFFIIKKIHFLFWQEIEQANKTMEELQGSLLPSSDRGGMHIEYFLVLNIHMPLSKKIAFDFDCGIL